MTKFPTLPSQVPSRGNRQSRFFFRQLMQLQGWNFVGEIPNIPKAVVILMPHTSNFDGWYGLLGLLGAGLKINILAKEDIFKPPLTYLLHKVNFIPVKRNGNHGLTEYAIELFKQKEKFWLGLAPEGTRFNAKAFKTGFYRIATEANVPLVLFSLDYKAKQLICLGQVNPTQNYDTDLCTILNQYKNNFYPKHLNRLSEPLKSCHETV